MEVGRPDTLNENQYHLLKDKIEMFEREKGVKIWEQALCVLGQNEYYIK